MDTTTLGRALERGMAAEGRLLKFKVSVADKPNGLADMCTMLAGIGASVRDCVPERACVTGDVTRIQVRNISHFLVKHPITNNFFIMVVFDL